MPTTLPSDSRAHLFKAARFLPLETDDGIIFVLFVWLLVLSASVLASAAERQGLYATPVNDSFDWTSM